MDLLLLFVLLFLFLFFRTLQEIKTIGDKNDCNPHVHFFRDLYAKLNASGVLSMTPKTLWWRQNEARERARNRINKSLLGTRLSYGVQKCHLIKSIENQQHVHSQNISCRSYFLNLLQAHEMFSLRRRVPLNGEIWLLFQVDKHCKCYFHLLPPAYGQNSPQVLCSRFSSETI